VALLLNRAKVYTTTTGTGTVTLGTVFAPYQSFASAGALNGKTYAYLIEDGANWEIGTGVYTSSGTTFSRSFQSSSTGSLLSLTGNATIAVVARVADYYVPPITQVTKTTAQSINNTTWTAVSWDTTAVVDDVGAFNGASPTVITVPSGYSRARVSVHTVWENGASGVLRYLQIDCSRSTTIGAGLPGMSVKSSANEAGDHAETPWLTGLQAGDTFTLQVLHNKGSASNFSPAAGFGQAWMQVEWAI
jgi:hypothetical protein